MRKTITTIAAITAALMLAGSTAVQASTTHKPPRPLTCFAGEFDAHAQRVGGTCFVGGMFLLTDQNGHKDFIWGLARSNFHGIEHVVIRADYTIAVNQMEVVLIGYVRYRTGLHKSWPFTNPARDKELCEFHWNGKDHPAFCPPVVNIEHVGGRIDQKKRPCIQDLSIHVPDLPANYSPNCSVPKQNGRDRYSTFLVWVPGHRILPVKIVNAIPLKDGFDCLTAPISESNNGFTHWLPEVEQLGPIQYWYEVPHLHAG